VIRISKQLHGGWCRGTEKVEDKNRVACGVQKNRREGKAQDLKKENFKSSM